MRILSKYLINFISSFLRLLFFPPSFLFFGYTGAHMAKKPNRMCLARRIPRVRNWLVTKCGFGHDVADDAASQAAVMALQYLKSKKIKKVKHHISWLYAVARCYAIRIAEARRNQQTVDPKTLRKRIAAPEVVEPDYQLAEQIERAMLCLTPKQEMAVKCCVMGGMSIREGAKNAYMSLSAFNGLLERGKRNLAKLLADRNNI